MSLAIVYSRASNGIHAPLVTVEAHLSNGMAGFNIVGLPETAVKESRDRVRSALMNSQFEFPVRRITVNLAPADLPKEGGRFDLPIALGILAASGQIPQEGLNHHEFTGELALSGALRPVRGVLPMALAAHQAGRGLIVPRLNAGEAALAGRANIVSACHLLDTCAYLKGESILPGCESERTEMPAAVYPDLLDVRGQPHARRALEIAAAGRHSLLFIGPPGTGKTMLASRLPGILPALNEQQALEAAAIASVSSGGFQAANWKQVPFRAPHHSSSGIALVGGGRPPRPGEISLAHHGVLFLDELPEFSRHVLDCLREPLESGHITISRAGYQTVYPASFQFVAAMNPCPCGNVGSAQDICQCSSEQVRRYHAKISGPLLDRIDMHVEAARLPPDVLLQQAGQREGSAAVRGRVIQARERQLRRQGKFNSDLTASELGSAGCMQREAEALLSQVIARFNLSARACHRIARLARTIADLEGADSLGVTHISEVLNYRCLDRKPR